MTKNTKGNQQTGQDQTNAEVNPQATKEAEDYVAEMEIEREGAEEDPTVTEPEKDSIY